MEEENKKDNIYKISENNINDNNIDDSELLIQQIQNIKLNLIKDVYEIHGYNLGNKPSNVETRNYLVDTPLEFGDYEDSNIDIDVNIGNFDGSGIIDKLFKLFPNAKNGYLSAALGILDKYGPNVGLNNKGKYMVLAQFAVESGRFIYTAEIGKGKGRKYGIPSGPYNKIYYGRGPIQITWEHNYKKISQEIFPKWGINVDIWANPDLCEKNLFIGCAASLAWFALPGNGSRAVQCANNGDIDGLSKAINGGWNGIEQRREFTKKIFACINA